MLPLSILILPITLISILYLSPSQALCYRKHHSAQFCQPNFINIAQNASATASSTCGSNGYSEHICNVVHVNNKCVTCNSMIRGMTHNISHLFDHHIKGHETCWWSGKIAKIRDIVNVTINLDNLYEAYYITMEFCGMLPDSVVLSKSNNNGKSWSLWHIFSSSCQKTFRMKRTSAQKMERKYKTQRPAPVCFSLPKHNTSIKSENYVIAFNPMIGRNMIAPHSVEVKDWASLTNIKVSMIVDNSRRTRMDWHSYLGISDVTIGGRPQCYGHASNLRLVNGTMVCDCRHNTGGSHCNTCLTTHNDLPWQPMTQSESSAMDCQKCFCNNHAKECTFDQSVFDKNLGVHGSKCINCSHNTAGPLCETCAHGYYRNTSTPINGTRACQKCKCHIIGAIAKSHCDPVTGKCHCKDGVDGPTCNKCKKGYQQTSSSEKPCVPSLDILKKMMATEARCELCGNRKARIKFKKFCRKDIMIKLSIQSKEILGNWSRFVVKIDTIWRLQPMQSTRASARESDYLMYPIWVENSNVRCSCPKFELGQTYLLVTNMRQKLYLNHPELIVDRKSLALAWGDSWHRRLNKFTEREKQGKCQKFKYRQRYSHNNLSGKYQQRYMSDG